jgi:hypothetical protein
MCAVLEKTADFHEISTHSEVSLVLVDDEYITENHAIMMYQPFLEESHSTISEDHE